jgi:hypothetical protein
MSLNPELFEKTDYLPTFKAQYSHIRGYGNIRVYDVNQNKVTVAIHPYSRLQPLTMPFGTHLPPGSTPEYLAANPQSTLAWATNVQQPASYPPFTY